ncbi:MAG: membrane protein insertase YidC [Phycisphaerae bacterium]|jgi:YidC/Oxa1 family membrane protein insertase
MPKPKNTGRRIVVTLLALAVGGVIVYTTLRGSTPSSIPKPVFPTPSQAPVAAEPASSAAVPAPVAAVPPSEPPAKEAAAAATNATGGPELRLRARVEAASGEAASIGSTDSKGKVRLGIEFAASGAGLKALRLAHHFQTIEDRDHVQIQRQHDILRGGQVESLVPFAALAAEITPAGGKPQFVGLFGDASGRVWRQTSPGAFEAVIEDDQGREVLVLTRRFVVSEDSSEIKVEQAMMNASGSPLTVRWFQTGPVDLDIDAAAYGGDRRHLRIGHLLPAARDPQRIPVTMGAFDKSHAALLSQRFSTTDGAGVSTVAYRDFTQWPTPESQQGGLELSWLAFNNRYFGVAVHPLFDAGATNGGCVPLAWVGQVDRVVLDGGDGAQVIGLRLASLPLAIAPGGKADISHGVFAGPLARKEIASEAVYKAMRLKDIVVYNFGGPCGWCTFSSVTSLLLWIMRSLHDIVFGDWALSIIFLVVIVRTCLHPLTRWTQIKMARFGKQMQALQPKQKVLQEKYASDPAKLQAETTKLWREEGISPAGFLGCLPAFAQTPVWIALSGVLFFAVELRHQHAFYGVFQSVFPAGSTFWHFLGDMAEPDRLIYFGRTLVTIPLLGPFSSINLLPLILGVMYYLQQTYFTPQTTTPTTPEQETQMKIMKYMTIFLFPALMYNAPAGLSLYFTVNTTLAILESKWIRSYMERHDMLNVEKMKAERQARAAAKGKATSGQGGLLAALERYAQEKQKQTERHFGQDRPKR